MYKNKKGEIIGIILTIIILVLLVILTNTENSNLSYVENVANKLVNTLQNGITYVNPEYIKYLLQEQYFNFHFNKNNSVGLSI